MLEIKTITAQTAEYFDETVNNALKDGWELVRRECFITGSDRATTFYAELEKIIDEPDVEETDENLGDDVARWVIVRNPRSPFKCSNCGYAANEQWAYCPECKKVMMEAADHD